MNDRNTDDTDETDKNACLSADRDFIRVNQHNPLNQRSHLKNEIFDEA